VRNYYKLLIGPIIDRFPHGIIPGLIERLTSAATFRTAEDLMSPLLPYFAQFNDAEIDMFIDASIQNGQIWDAVKCKRIYLPKFLDIHRSRIVPDKLAKIEYQIQHSRPYFSREDE